MLACTRRLARGRRLPTRFYGSMDCKHGPWVKTKFTDPRLRNASIFDPA